MGKRDRKEPTGAEDMEAGEKSKTKSRKTVSGSEDAKDEPGAEKTLYDILNVDKTADPATIKKAYHKLALACHPDKHPDDPQAKENFQQLQKVKEVLLDEKKRRVYDETGVIPGEDGMGDLSGKSFDELYEYYRALYQAVTTKDLEEWEAKYPGSKEEKEDLKEYYQKFDGNMKNVCAHIPFCEDEDRWRIKEVVDQMIEDGEIEATEKYAKFKPKKLSAKQVKAMKENREPEEGWEDAKEELSQKKKGGMGDLMALIQAKQTDRASAFDSMTAALEAKYCTQKPKKSGGKKR
mmetsp:Transcript_70906/g.147766  ORF Transcript_70906/g.147766 Transcript_70906/m.147766 type:complete len:293 (-) Transcript_70906:586-1464(-)